jgi:phage terminase large subunit-like protein
VNEIDVKKKILELKQAELELRIGLPFLHGRKHYTWSRDFFEDRNRKAFITAANQIGKSSCQIRRDIDWATDPSKWEELWPTDPKPNLFWYFYPTSTQATTEFDTKWQEFLPRNTYRPHPQFGWEEEKDKKEIRAIHFKSGVTLQFKSYAQGLGALQTATVYKVSLDEECPEELWPELVFRTQAVRGYISAVFTATIGQEFWRKVMEPAGPHEELFPEAFKRQVSMYDCQKYVDGSASKWTDERINEVIASCGSPQEVQRRVFGKFVKSEGLKYPHFDVKRHMKPWHPIPKNWNYYVGVDIGAGGAEGHPSAITWVAVNPNYQEGRVVACWRGDGLRTAASDVFNKYLEMKKELGVEPVGKYYDWGSVEFGEIAIRNGSGFERAEKSHDIGEKYINTLFRNDMLFIYERGDSGKLAGELCSVTLEGPKRKKKDDACFVAGTLVATPTGEKPIEELCVGDLVLTSAGPRPIQSLMRSTSRVKRYRFSNGASLVATPNHPVATKERGFVALDDLTPYDTICTLPEWQKQSCSTELNLGGTQILLAGIFESIIGLAEVIAVEEWALCTKKFGKLLTGQSPLIAQSTIGTGIPSTMRSPIWSAWTNESTLRTIVMKGSWKTQNSSDKQLKKLFWQPLHGTNLQKGVLGTARMPRRLTLKESFASFTAKYAGFRLRQKILGKLRDFAGALARLGHVAPVYVYNLSVQDKHEYFANGILAANCDSFRYCVTKIPWDWSITGIDISQPVEVVEKTATQIEIEARRKAFESEERENDRIQEEFDEWNDLSGG